MVLAHRVDHTILCGFHATSAIVSDPLTPQDQSWHSQSGCDGVVSRFGYVTIPTVSFG